MNLVKIKEKKMKKFYLLITIFGLFFAGCMEKNQYVVNGKMMGENDLLTLGLDRADFEYAAQKSVESLLRSGALDNKQGGRYVVAMGKVINDTTEHIDTDLLTKKIRIALLNSKKAVMTTAVSGNGSQENLTYDVRDLRNNEEFNQSTIAKKGTILAPDFALSGKIIQKIAQTSAKKALVSYYFQLTLTDLTSGLAFWEDENIIEKIGSNKSVVW